MDYKNTIITPKTDFPMKAGLPTREPGMLSRWEEQNLYEAMLEKNSTVLQPLQVYGHTNITQALTRLLVEQGYDDSVADAVQVQLLDAGKRNGSNDSIQYIAEDGSITYYTGALGNSTNTVQYLGLKFRLTLEGQSVEVTTRACVGWDVEYVTNLLQQAADSVTRMKTLPPSRR